MLNAENKSFSATKMHVTRTHPCRPPELVKKYVAWVEIKVMNLPNQKVKLRLHATKICAALNI